MALKIYNTLSRSKEDFKPLKEKEVGFYQCGPTVYWTQHIGNMRAVVMGDLVVRTLKYSGFDVTFVRNYTDVGHLTSDGDEGEDKMEKGAKREGLMPAEIAQKYISIYENDVTKLNIIQPQHKLRATKYINEMIEMINTLIEKGFAYSTDLAIYFDITKAKDYTKLSGQITEENIQGAGSGEVSDPKKKNPADFVLWFFRVGVHKNALQFWNSPFITSQTPKGEGFPGWHIECSAMSKKCLGDTIDIHMGGIEHIPVHHTNEIAQSEAANGVKYVNYWIHNSHLQVYNKKMSKSEGTSYSLSELIEKGFDPLDLRYFFLQAHYRSNQNFTWEALESAKAGLKNLYKQVADLGEEIGTVNLKFQNDFKERVGDDFNIPQALATISELLKSDLSKQDKLATILDFDNVLGLKLKEAKNKIEAEIQEKDLPQDIRDLISERQLARQNKDYTASDNLRDKIEEAGYVVKDTIDGQKIYKK